MVPHRAPVQLFLLMLLVYLVIQKLAVLVLGVLIQLLRLQVLHLVYFLGLVNLLVQPGFLKSSRFLFPLKNLIRVNIRQVLLPVSRSMKPIKIFKLLYASDRDLGSVVFKRRIPCFLWLEMFDILRLLLVPIHVQDCRAMVLMAASRHTTSKRHSRILASCRVGDRLMRLVIVVPVCIPMKLLIFDWKGRIERLVDWLVPISSSS